MNNTSKLDFYRPEPPDAAGVLTWVHIGDLHMRAAGRQNDLDLQAIVKEINAVFAGSISFVYLPGDNADHGDVQAYTVIRRSLDRLRAPWCAIVGDHDVEQKRHDHFRTFMAERTHYTFLVGDVRFGVRFLALNAFDVPEPSSFAVLPEQLRWIENQLREAQDEGQQRVILLHCYPSDLKQGGKELRRLISAYAVKLVAMGHTHYNEISNDGRTLYTATRSTGQIEEGPVGFSVTNLDKGVVSWRFLELGQLPAVIITTPADERLFADAAELRPAEVDLRVRAKVWAENELLEVKASLGKVVVSMQQVPGSNVWEATIPGGGVPPGIHPLRVVAKDAQGKKGSDEIQALFGSDRPSRERAERDQDNALEAWPEHGLLGTRLGPNKNGRKW